jgi:hypothetical protein
VLLQRNTCLKSYIFLRAMFVKILIFPAFSELEAMQNLVALLIDDDDATLATDDDDGDASNNDDDDDDFSAPTNPTNV